MWFKFLHWLRWEQIDLNNHQMTVVRLIYLLLAECIFIAKIMSYLYNVRCDCAD